MAIFTMPRVVYWAYKIWLRRLHSKLKDKYILLKLVLWSLFYNSFVDIYYVADTAMEPIFWFVDHFTRFFGPLFVFAVCTLLLAVVVIAYVIGVPYWWHHNPTVLIVLLIFGNWLLVNVVFHYYMAATTQPGYMPEGVMIPEAVSICKKCIMPKPPRTHHCSICNRCILKMDHHCPWMNICIGHFNHRYFYLFCIYTVAGALFILIFGLNIFLDHYYEYREPMTIDKLIVTRYDAALPWRYETWYHSVLTFEALLCFGVVLALGWLTVWHSRMIARGETSIEAHINRAETVRLKKEGKVYVNPYNFGKYMNWMLFLGIHKGRTWRHVLLPSAHSAEGSGLQWKTVHNMEKDIC